MNALLFLGFYVAVWASVSCESCDEKLRGKDYRGCVSEGPNGEKCLNWRSWRITKYKNVDTNGKVNY